MPVKPPKLIYPIVPYDTVHSGKEGATRCELENVWRWREENGVANLGPLRDRTLPPGVQVKVIAMGESFWCIVEAPITHSFPRCYRVKVDNDLVCTKWHGIGAYDTIIISDYNVKDISW